MSAKLEAIQANIVVHECAASAHDARFEKIIFACFDAAMLARYKAALAAL